MSDPSRLCEDSATDAFEGVLLRSALLDREPEDGAARALAALGLATAAVEIGTAGTSTTVKAASAAGTSIATKVVTIIVATSSILASIVAIASSGENTSSAVAASTRTAAPVTSSTPFIATASAMAPEPELAPVSVAELPPAPSSTHAVPPRSPRVDRQNSRPAVASTAASAKVSVSEEIALIDQARAAMTAGNLALADRTLDAYEARFGGGTLLLEAKLARIELHLARGEHAQARELGERFLREHPRTAYDRRVRALLRPARSETTIPQ